MSRNDVKYLEEKHVISSLLYIRDHPGCKKSELYVSVSKNPRMPHKLNLLESMGLINLEIRGDSTATFLYLTPKGVEVAEYLNNVANTL